MTQQERADVIERIRRLPGIVEALVQGLTPEMLTTHFLPNEWTVAQNVHHLADDQMHLYSRCKLIATEHKPILKPFDQDTWALLPDAMTANVADSITLLKGLYARAVPFFEACGESDWAREGVHLEGGLGTLEHWFCRFAGHAELHIEQIQQTLAARRRD